MSLETDQQKSISSLFSEADALKDDLANFPDSNGNEYQTRLLLAIHKYEQIKDVVSRASLFSLNESLEDLATADMRYCFRSLNECVPV